MRVGTSFYALPYLFSPLSIDAPDPECPKEAPHGARQFRKTFPKLTHAGTSHLSSSGAVGLPSPLLGPVGL